jgi:hypothetical protein
MKARTRALHVITIGLRSLGALGFGAALTAAPAVRAGMLAPLVPDQDRPDLVLRRVDWIEREPQTLEDLLRWVTGFAIARSGGQGSAEMLSGLGSVNGRIQLAVNGIEITSPELEWPRLHAVPLGMVDRIEIFRCREPARIAVWLREPITNAAAADFDVGRGSVESRTRRVQLLTPERVLAVTAAYDEVLRGDEDFRTDISSPPRPELGAFDDRTQLVRIDLRRRDDVVRLSHLRDNTNTHGSFQNQADVWHADAVRTDLRWDREDEAMRWALVVGHQAWDHQRTIAGASGPLREARTHAALDIGRSGAWTTWLRLRTALASGDGRATGNDAASLDYRQHAAEFEVGNPNGLIAWTAHAGIADDARAEAEVVGGARAETNAGPFRLALEGGHGVRYAGYGAAGDEARRRGEYASATLRHLSGTLDLQAQAFTKHLRDRRRATGAFFPGSGGGPERMSGGIVEARWVHAVSNWRFRVVAGSAWIPDVEGDPAGTPELQGVARLGVGITMRGGDLTVDAFSDWTSETRRQWGTTPSLAPAARGDVGIDIGFLRRLHFFGNIQNWTDARTESFSGVLLPGRTYFFGVRARLLD